MSDQEVKDVLDGSSRDPARRILFTGGSVVTMDPAIGDLSKGDVIVEGSKIVDVGSDLCSLGAADDAIVIDATGSIVCPGLVDTHRHAWETQLRRTIPDVNDLGEYVVSTLARIAPVYTPHDIYVGTRLAALTALDSGVNLHARLVAQFPLRGAFRSRGSRAPRYGHPRRPCVDEPALRGVGQWPADVTRLKQRYFCADDQLLTLRLAALATDEICGPRLAYGPELGQVARDLDIGVSVDAVFGAGSSAAILRWARDGLLKPRLTLVHSTGLSPDAWRAMGDAGVIVAPAPTSDAQIGLESAVPAIDESLSVGIRPGLSIDVEVALVSEMFTQMRTLLAIQRMRAVNAVYGIDETPQRITTRDVLDFATLQGARTNGLDDITGSLTPGTQADLLLVHAEDINNMPLNDAVGRSCSAPKHATSTPSSSRVSPANGTVNCSGSTSTACAPRCASRGTRSWSARRATRAPPSESFSGPGPTRRAPEVDQEMPARARPLRSAGARGGRYNDNNKEDEHDFDQQHGPRRSLRARQATAGRGRWIRR